MSEIKIASKTVEVAIDDFGCMTTGAFKLKNRTIHPMYQAPWLDNTKEDFLSHLQGDFLCVPFGIYEKEDADADEVYPHGYAASNYWNQLSKDTASVTMGLPYNHSVVKGVQRTVTCHETTPIMIFKDMIEVHKEGSLPIGLHPIFKLPTQSGNMHLLPPVCAFIKTYHERVDDSSIFRHDEMFHHLDEAPLKRGGVMDVSKLPKEEDFEEVIMLCNVKEGKFILENHQEKYRVILRWDVSVLSSCLLWISNKGRKEAPWNGRNLCLGIEPITSAFDLGVPISTNNNPLTEIGVATSISFKAGEQKVIEHSIEVQSL